MYDPDLDIRYVEKVVDEMQKNHKEGKNPFLTKTKIHK